MPGVNLNSQGRDEARRAAVRLSRAELAAVYASPLERARETAEAIGAAAGLQVGEAPELNELDFGGWTGLTFDALHQEPTWADWNRERSACRPPGGETMAEAQVRALGWIAQAVREHRGRPVAAVCHGDVIKAVVCAALDLPLDHHHRLHVDPGSITRIEAAEGAVQARTINEVPPADA